MSLLLQCVNFQVSNVYSYVGPSSLGSLCWLCSLNYKHIIFCHYGCGSLACKQNLNILLSFNQEVSFYVLLDVDFSYC